MLGCKCSCVLHFNASGNSKMGLVSKDKSKLFYMVKNKELYEILETDKSKNKFLKIIKIKDNSFYEGLLKNNQYDLIINCDPNNFLSRKYFTKKINKDYNNLAFTTIFKHEKCNCMIKSENIAA